MHQVLSQLILHDNPNPDISKLNPTDQFTLTHFLGRCNKNLNTLRSNMSYAHLKRLLNVQLGEIDAGNDSHILKGQAIQLAEHLYRVGVLKAAELKAIRTQLIHSKSHDQHPPPYVNPYAQ